MARKKGEGTTPRKGRLLPKKLSGVGEGESLVATSISMPDSQMKTLRLACEMSGDTVSGIIRKALNFYFDTQNKAKTFKIQSYVPHIEQKVMIPVEMYAAIRNIEPITIQRWSQQKKIEIHKVENGVGDFIEMVSVEINDPVATKAKLSVLEGMLAVLFENFKEAFTREAQQEHQIKILSERVAQLEKLCVPNPDKTISE